MKKINNFFVFCLIFVFTTSLVLGQFTRIEITPAIAVYIQDFILGFIYLFWIYRKPKFKFYFRHSSISHSMLILIAVLTISLLLSPQPSGLNIVFPIAYLLRFSLYFLSIFAFADLLNVNRIKYYLLYLGLGLMFGGLIQYLFFPDLRLLGYLGWDPHYFRAAGSILDPNYFGMTMVLLLILIFNSKLTFKYALGSVAYLMLMLSYSRSSYVAYLTGLIVLSIIKKSPKFLIVSLLLFGLSIMILPQPGGEGVKLSRTNSVVSRGESMTAALDLWKQKPLFGIGFNNYKNYTQPLLEENQNYHPSAPDNSFLLILSTSGILGLIAFCFYLYRLIIIFKSDSVVMPSIAAILIHSLFNNTFFFTWVIVWLTLLVLGYIHQANLNSPSGKNYKLAKT